MFFGFWSRAWLSPPPWWVGLQPHAALLDNPAEHEAKSLFHFYIAIIIIFNKNKQKKQSSSKRPILYNLLDAK